MQSPPTGWGSLRRLCLSTRSAAELRLWFEWFCSSAGRAPGPHPDGREFESPWSHVKLWFDDVRPPPDETWTWAKNNLDAFHEVAEMRLRNETFQALSLDHDLGDHHDNHETNTRFFVQTALITWGNWPEKVYVHSMNPVGREWLEGTIARYRPRADGG